MRDLVCAPPQSGGMWIHGARCSFGPREALHASIEVADTLVTSIGIHSHVTPQAGSVSNQIDLSGFLLMPGLINAHDHLQFALFPRLGNALHLNYIDWGEDIHRTSHEVIARHRSVPKSVRLWWGGIRNVLCGVTTACHHDPLWPEMKRGDFPVRVVPNYGWAHSLAHGGDLRAARFATPAESAFIVHACEGTDDRARNEIIELEQLGLLDEAAVLVHGLALDEQGVAIMRKHRSSLIVCPSSNEFLFGKLPDMKLLGQIDSIALGNDSPLTAVGDLLDEIRFAARACNITAVAIYHMVTQAPATILRLREARGAITVAGAADLIAVRDTGLDPADRLTTMSMRDVEFVMIGGQVRLASEGIWERLPSESREGLRPLSIDGTVRWLRAPVDMLLRKAEDVLGVGQVRLGGRAISIPVHAV